MGYREVSILILLDAFLLARQFQGRLTWLPGVSILILLDAFLLAHMGQLFDVITRVSILILLDAFLLE